MHKVVHFAQFWPNCFKQIWQNDYVSKKKFFDFAAAE